MTLFGGNAGGTRRGGPPAPERRGAFRARASAQRVRLAAAAAVVALMAATGRGSSQPTPTTDARSAGAREIDAAALDAAVHKLDDDVRGLGGQLGAAVVDVDSGRLLAASGEHKPLNPASNEKLVTAALVLSKLGPAHRFATGLYGARQGDAVTELVIRGDGDPSLGAAHLWSLAHALYDAGVRRVGSVLVDQSAFDDKFVPPGFEAQPHEWAAFRAPVSAVALESNTITVVVRPQKKGSDAAAAVEPAGFVELSGTIRTTGRGDPEGVSVDLEPRGGRLVAKLGGHVPEGGRPVRIVRRVDDPRLYAGYVLGGALRSVGIATGNEVRLGGEAQKSLLAVHRSEPVGELLTALGKESDNFYAETLFKAVAAKEKGKPGRTEAAAELARAYLESLGALDTGVAIRNGSGLFDGARTTAAALTALLRASYRDPAIGPEYVAQLSIGGVDGTLKSRLRRWGKLRVVRAKTGTLEGVASLSGYVLGPPGRGAVAFALIVNGVAGKLGEARVSMDRVVDAIATQLHGARRGSPASVE